MINHKCSTEAKNVRLPRGGHYICSVKIVWLRKHLSIFAGKFSQNRALTCVLSTHSDRNDYSCTHSHHNYGAEVGTDTTLGLQDLGRDHKIFSIVIESFAIFINDITIDHDRDDGWRNSGCRRSVAPRVVAKDVKAWVWYSMMLYRMATS